MKWAVLLINALSCRVPGSYLAGDQVFEAASVCPDCIDRLDSPIGFGVVS
jgi:hypothetical protein